MENGEIHNRLKGYLGYFDQEETVNRLAGKLGDLETHAEQAVKNVFHTAEESLSAREYQLALLLACAGVLGLMIGATLLAAKLSRRAALR